MYRVLHRRDEKRHSIEDYVAWEVATIENDLVCRYHEWARAEASRAIISEHGSEEAKMALRDIKLWDHKREAHRKRLQDERKDRNPRDSCKGTSKAATTASSPQLEETSE